MESHHESKVHQFAEIGRRWSLMTMYGRFEQIVALALAFLIAVIVAIALLQLILQMFPLLLGGAFDPLHYEVFQSLFGTIMTLLIAMEFKHSIIQVSLRRQSVVQVKTVVLIALLVLSRKLIILDVTQTEATTTAAIAGSSLELGIVYWFLRERDDRLDGGNTTRDVMETS